MHTMKLSTASGNPGAVQYVDCGILARGFLRVHTVFPRTRLTLGESEMGPWIG